MTVARRVIPIALAPVDASPACADTEEVFALMVMGDAMLPEFVQGDVIVVEPQGQAQSGSYVVARLDGDWALRQLLRHEGRWWLHALDARTSDAPLRAWDDIRGVVIQKRPRGRRRCSISYV